VKAIFDFRFPISIGHAKTHAAKPQLLDFGPLLAYDARALACSGHLKREASVCQFGA
jgi:hypothetical protein